MKKRTKNVVCDPYSLKNLFGFAESDTDMSESDISLSGNSTDKTSEFRTDKPYRLALYIQPACKRRRLVSMTSTLPNTTLNLNVKNTKKPELKKEKSNTSEKKTETTHEKTKTIRSAQVKTKKTKNNKVRFEDNPEKDIENVQQKPQLIQRKINTRAANKKAEYNSFFDGKDSSFNTRVNRRSYEKKFKESEPQEEEPPSQEIIKELELKKTSRTKPRTKKPAKEEQEFENWAKSMNSAFDDVEKFELSINYD